ncbi:hypothetical protein ACFO1B_22170 [Dactylosporangium siamense]|uniref:Uncharacterized protein n=1 Tax=Dactylosporangium siamense TaxID=685454 RepID=A0A919PTV6_9ACTN|nr:hypothetical protein [Dactylosporangium siamense]GIG50099.1 hypothetical protein Dsi01nite_081400 [Dactylosporangium siamense]
MTGDARQTYFGHATALAATHGPGPWPHGGHPQPDRPRPLLSDTVLDGVLTHHARNTPDPATATQLAHLIQALLTGPPTPAALQHLHDAAATHRALSVADPLTTELAGLDLPTAGLRRLGRWLAEHGTHPSPVALGLVLLGLAGDHRDRDLLLLLGTLESLSLYAIVALARSQPDPEAAIFTLAQRVDGWGRIHAVERLRGTPDPRIKAWLLRDGFRNRIMDEYLAHLAATTGDLLQALRTAPVDDALLDGAAGILSALCIGGPAEEITDYADAAETIEQYLTLAGQRPPNLERIATVLRLARFLASDRATYPDRTRLRQRCDGLTGRPDWILAADRALDDPDLARFRLAIAPAQHLGIPTRPRVRARLHEHPDDPYLWQVLTDDIDDVIALARHLLPLDALGTGPTRGGRRGALPAHHVLDLIVGRLDAHPGKGWPLIRVALASPTTHNRTMAVRALGAWPAGTVPAEAFAAVEHASRIEPDATVRNKLRHLLGTWTGADPGPSR